MSPGPERAVGFRLITGASRGRVLCLRGRARSGSRACAGLRRRRSPEAARTAPGGVCVCVCVCVCVAASPQPSPASAGGVCGLGRPHPVGSVGPPRPAPAAALPHFTFSLTVLPRLLTSSPPCPPLPFSAMAPGRNEEAVCVRGNRGREPADRSLSLHAEEPPDPKSRVGRQEISESTSTPRAHLDLRRRIPRYAIRTVALAVSSTLCRAIDPWSWTWWRPGAMDARGLSVKTCVRNPSHSSCWPVYDVLQVCEWGSVHDVALPSFAPPMTTTFASWQGHAHFCELCWECSPHYTLLA